MNKLIVFTGKAGSGKSTVTKHLRIKLDQKSIIISFADPIRNIFYALGLTEQHLKGDLKEVPCDLLSGVTPRYAMQTIGTNWARNIIHQDFWINIWKSRVQGYLNEYIIITDDCRFLNEEKIVKEMGGIIFRLVRDIRDIETANHESEKEITFIKEDHIIDNNRSVDDVVDEIMKYL